MEVTLVELAQQFGPLVALVIFFTWQGWKREQRLSDRITALETEYTAALKELVMDCKEVIHSNTEILRRLEERMQVPS